MSEFIDIVRNKNRLRAACKELSIEQMQTIADNLSSFIAQRAEEQADAAAAIAEQAAKKEEILAAINAAGLSLTDFVTDDAQPKIKKPRKPVVAQYRINDAQGSIHEWSGRGRTPKAFQAYFDKGGSKETCRI